MMNANEYNLERQLSRYLAGEMSEAEVHELHRVIQEDPSLIEALEEYQLTRYIDGELTPDEARALLERIRSEPALVEALAEYESLDAVLSTLGDEVLDVDYDAQREAISQALDARQGAVAVSSAPAPAHTSPRFWRRRGFRASVAMLATAATILIAFGVYRLIGLREQPVDVAGERIASAEMHRPHESAVAAGVVRVEMARLNMVLSERPDVHVGAVVVSIQGPARPAAASGTMTMTPWMGG